MRCSHCNDGDSDEYRQPVGGEVGVEESSNAEQHSRDAEKQHQPPAVISHFLVVEALYGDEHALEKHPHREDDSQRKSDKESVGEEQNTDDDLQQSR